MAGTTTNNGWDYPTSTDLLKDGALAIQTLATDIDTSVGTGLLAWTSYAPTLAVGWANGNGVWTAKYARLGKIVHVQARFVIGSTTTKGTGLYVNVPFGFANINAVNATASCDIGGTVYPLISSRDSTVYFQMLALNTAGTYATANGITSSVPATWATGNSFTFDISYETSA